VKDEPGDQKYFEIKPYRIEAGENDAAKKQGARNSVWKNVLTAVSQE
jgi:hypothetical protein